jgi:hypothetical protein
MSGRLFLYFDCDHPVALSIVNRLRNYGLFVELWGPTRSPARNGRLYRYFLQVARPSDDGNLPDLGDVFNAVEELRSLQQPDETAKLRAELEEVRQAYAARGDQLRDARTTIRNLEVQRDTAIREVKRLADENQALQSENQALQSQLAQALSRSASQELVHGRLQQLEQETTSLRKRITDQDQKLHNFEKLLAEEKAKNSDLHEEVCQLQEHLDKRPEADAPEVGEVMQSLLPRLILLPESLGYVFRGIKERRFIFDLLCKLNQDHRLIDHKTTKSVETADGWMERHFSTGQGNEGRLYYSKPDAAGRRYVLVAPKSEQKQSIRKLQKLVLQ